LACIALALTLTTFLFAFGGLGKSFVGLDISGRIFITALTRLAPWLARLALRALPLLILFLTLLGIHEMSPVGGRGGIAGSCWIEQATFPADGVGRVLDAGFAGKLVFPWLLVGALYDFPHDAHAAVGLRADPA